MSELGRPAHQIGPEDLIDHFEEMGEERGHFQPIGLNHASIFTDKGRTLLVTFERVADFGEAAEPLGFRLTERHDWSQLAVLAFRDTWFRDVAVHGYFDRLIDDGFFEDFDKVVFFGTGMCGYAAAAYSVAAAGATVLVIQPQATLAPSIAGWDTRYPEARLLDFTTRYGFSPAMIEAARDVYIIYDPHERLDAIHAAMFIRDHVTLLPCRNMGQELEHALRAMGLLGRIVTMAVTDRLTRPRFYRLMRARRTCAAYLKRLLDLVLRKDRPVLTALLCRNVTRRARAPKFRRHLDAAMAQIEERGLRLPRTRR